MTKTSDLEWVLREAVREPSGPEPEPGSALRSPANIRLWRDLLSRDYRRICRAADEIIGQGEQRRYLHALTGVVRATGGRTHVQSRHRRSALEALSVIGDVDRNTAFEAIASALHDASWEIRQYAAWALGQLGDPRAVSLLIDTLKDESPYVRFVAASALGRFATPSTRAALNAYWSQTSEPQ